MSVVSEFLWLLYSYKHTTHYFCFTYDLHFLMSAKYIKRLSYKETDKGLETYDRVWVYVCICSFSWEEIYLV